MKMIMIMNDVAILITSNKEWTNLQKPRIMEENYLKAYLISAKLQISTHQ